jgi:hypothetical protein
MAGPRRIVLPLSAAAAEALSELSQREYRHPREQAELFVVEGLRRAGVLDDKANTAKEAARA